MSEKMIENNKVSVIGEIVSGFTFSHEVFGEGFYMVDLAVNRLSDQADVIPLMISERLIDVNGDYSGCTIEAVGQFRSYNRHEGTKNRLVLSVFFMKRAPVEARILLAHNGISVGISVVDHHFRRFEIHCHSPLSKHIMIYSILYHTIYRISTPNSSVYKHMPHAE